MCRLNPKQISKRMSSQISSGTRVKFFEMCKGMKLIDMTEYSHIIQYTGPFCKYVRQSKPMIRNLTTFEDCLSRWAKEAKPSSPTDKSGPDSLMLTPDEGKRRRSQIQATKLGFSPSGGLVQMYGSYSDWFIDPSTAMSSPQS
mmetsp:Transcript_18027/g.59206  ORF Transcript_18027/g.59206 Transcript_18027/m.59206 type:complete len:143 (-) Transcript_18027:1837-2265(-)